MTDSIRSAIEAASKYLTDQPEEARYTDSLATANNEEGLRVRVDGPNGEVLVTDMPSGVGGGGSAPSPGWFWRAAIAACVSSLAAMRAAQLGIEGFTCEIAVDSASDDRGILGLDSSIPAGPLSVRIGLRLTASSAGSDVLDAIGHWAVEHCPVSEAIGRVIPVQVDVNA